MERRPVMSAAPLQVCVAVLQWLEKAVASTQNPLHKALRSPVDVALAAVPEGSPLNNNRVRPGKKVQAGRLQKVCQRYTNGSHAGARFEPWMVKSRRYCLMPSSRAWARV